MAPYINEFDYCRNKDSKFVDKFARNLPTDLHAICTQFVYRFAHRFARNLSTNLHAICPQICTRFAHRFALCPQICTRFAPDLPTDLHAICTRFVYRFAHKIAMLSRDAIGSQLIRDNYCLFTGLLAYETPNVYVVLNGGIAFSYVLNQPINTPDLDGDLIITLPGLINGPFNHVAYHNHSVELVLQYMLCYYAKHRSHFESAFKDLHPITSEDLNLDIELRNGKHWGQFASSHAWIGRLESQYFNKLVLVVKVSRDRVHRLVEIKYTKGLLQQPRAMDTMVRAAPMAPMCAPRQIGICLCDSPPYMAEMMEKSLKDKISNMQRLMAEWQTVSPGAYRFECLEPQIEYYMERYKRISSRLRFLDKYLKNTSQEPVNGQRKDLVVTPEILIAEVVDETDSSAETTDESAESPDAAAESPDAAAESPDAAAESPDAAAESPDAAAESPDAADVPANLSTDLPAMPEVTYLIEFDIENAPIRRGAVIKLEEQERQRRVLLFPNCSSKSSANVVCAPDIMLEELERQRRIDMFPLSIDPKSSPVIVTYNPVEDLPAMPEVTYLIEFDIENAPIRRGAVIMLEKQERQRRVLMFPNGSEKSSANCTTVIQQEQERQRRIDMFPLSIDPKSSPVLITYNPVEDFRSELTLAKIQHHDRFIEEIRIGLAIHFRDSLSHKVSKKIGKDPRLLIGEMYEDQKDPRPIVPNLLNCVSFLIDSLPAIDSLSAATDGLHSVQANKDNLNLLSHIVYFRSFVNEWIFLNSAELISRMRKLLIHTALDMTSAEHVDNMTQECFDKWCRRMPEEYTRMENQLEFLSNTFEYNEDVVQYENFERGFKQVLNWNAQTRCQHLVRTTLLFIHESKMRWRLRVNQFVDKFETLKKEMLKKIEEANVDRISKEISNRMKKLFKTGDGRSHEKSKGDPNKVYERHELIMHVDEKLMLTLFSQFQKYSASMRDELANLKKEMDSRFGWFSQRMAPSQEKNSGPGEGLLAMALGLVDVSALSEWSKECGSLFHADKYSDLFLAADVDGLRGSKKVLAVAHIIDISIMNGLEYLKVSTKKLTVAQFQRWLNEAPPA